MFNILEVLKFLKLYFVILDTPLNIREAVFKGESHLNVISFSSFVRLYTIALILFCFTPLIYNSSGRGPSYDI